MSLHLVQDQRITAAVFLPSLQHFVYELICNSIEANATSIQIVIGKDLVICKDNGHGIKDLNLIGTQGATSKLNHRGVALHSMNVLCKLQVTTKCKSDKMGQRWMNNEIQPFPFNYGTQVHLSSIYHNLPVRRKHLDQHFNKELAKCILLLQCFALLYPIEWIFDKILVKASERVICYKQESDLIHRLNSLFTGMHAISISNANGYINFSSVKETRLCLIYNDEPLLLNFEKHKNLVLLKKLLKQAYQTFSLYKYIVILDIKHECHYLTEILVHEITNSIINELQQYFDSLQMSSFQSQSVLSSSNATYTQPENNADVRVFGPTDLNEHKQTVNILKQTTMDYGVTESVLLFKDVCCTSEIEHDLKISDFKDMVVVGQFNLGFILCMLKCNATNIMYIIDQHASDEIYNFENLLKSKNISKYPLLTPKLIKFNPSELLLFNRYSQQLKDYGFEFMVDDDQVYMIVIPVYNNVEFNENDIFDILHQLENGNKVALPLKLKSKLASKACRSSIMIGDVLQHQEMRQIVHNLSKLDKPWKCPHGRPTVKLLRGFQ
eukprot:NODE_269_length_12236_cov_0.516932.p2 type:complete len:552 gc:universal NODE_269_length_12236_cov_0.516932:10230-11885(+)